MGERRAWPLRSQVHFSTVKQMIDGVRAPIVGGDVKDFLCDAGLGQRGHLIVASFVGFHRLFHDVHRHQRIIGGAIGWQMDEHSIELFAIDKRKTRFVFHYKKWKAQRWGVQDIRLRSRQIAIQIQRMLQILRHRHHPHVFVCSAFNDVHGNSLNRLI